MNTPTPRSWGRWAAYFLFWVLVIVAAGAAVGALTFPLVGPLFGSQRGPLAHALAGARHLGFITLIWAPGIALVLCVSRAHRNRPQ